MPGFPFGMPFPINPDDPEVQAAILRQKQAAENAEIKTLEWKDRFARLLKTASREELSLLSDIFASLVRSPDMANFYLGLLNASMTHRFDTCPMCGEDHAQELHQGMEDLLKEAAPSEGLLPVIKETNESWLTKDYDTSSIVVTELETTVDQMSNQPPVLMEFLPGAFDKAEQEVRALNYDFRDPTKEQLAAISKLAGEAPPRPLPQHMEEMALQYGIEDAWEQLAGDGKEILKFVGWQCNNCGKIYSSLQDRMMKPPGIEGCDGCIHKVKWG